MIAEKEKQSTEKRLKPHYGYQHQEIVKIQEVIKPGQVDLVQVIKEERGQKRSCSDNFYITSR